MTDLQLLSQRLAKIENRFRWMKRAAIVLGILMAAGGVMAQRGQELDQLDPLRTLRRPDPTVPAVPGRLGARARPIYEPGIPKPAPPLTCTSAD